jgi:hypothetical protein
MIRNLLPPKMTELVLRPAVSNAPVRRAGGTMREDRSGRAGRPPGHRGGPAGR